MQEIVIKVPAPFAGTDLLGFSARYPEQELNVALRDVTFFIEGQPDLVGRLWPHLARFPETSRRAGEGYLWTDPVLISDELAVMSFRDRSAELEPGDAAHRYFANMLQPLALPFLRDCVRVANLRLAEEFELTLTRADDVLARIRLGLAQVVPENGTVSLVA
ncbi:MAG TPA: hypothetical protein VG245_01920 [Candidatus Dormibacteraeota bacterium]|nr:hypothetical protein [Candidatus Dormibacteraeota bacterium]